MKHKEKTEELFDLNKKTKNKKTSKEAWQMNAKHDLEFSFAIKDIIRTVGKSEYVLQIK